MKDINKLALEKETSRRIVKEIENFGVSESQKIDILYFLALTLQKTDDMKKICDFLKNFKNDINTDENKININKSESQKIILE